MGIEGRPILKDLTLKEVEQAIIDCYGKIADVAKKLQCTRPTIYDLIDIYPELQEARVKALNTLSDVKVETADKVLDKLLDKVNEDPSNAFKAAQLILTKSKKSHYFDDSKNKDKPNELDTLRELAQILKDPS